MPKTQEPNYEDMDLEALDEVSANLEAQRDELSDLLRRVNERRTALNVERELAARHPNPDLDQTVGG